MTKGTRARPSSGASGHSFQPIHLKMIEAEGPWTAEKKMRARRRVALDYVRFQGLVPDEKKDIVAAAREKTEAVHLSQVEAFTTAEKRHHNRKFNVACLNGFAEVLAGLVEQERGLGREPTKASLRGARMATEELYVGD